MRDSVLYISILEKLFLINKELYPGFISGKGVPR
jgi:hypothetical protein